MSKHNLWVECEKHKRFVKLLNDKLLKNQEVKNQPQDVVILHEKIRTLKTTLAKFVNGIDNLNKLLGYCRSSSKNMEIDMIGSESIGKNHEAQNCDHHRDLRKDDASLSCDDSLHPESPMYGGEVDEEEDLSNIQDKGSSCTVMVSLEFVKEDEYFTVVVSKSQQKKFHKIKKQVDKAYLIPISIRGWDLKLLLDEGFILECKSKVLAIVSIMGSTSEGHMFNSLADFKLFKSLKVASHLPSVRIMMQPNLNLFLDFNEILDVILARALEAQNQQKVLEGEIGKIEDKS
ncbi:hypothetical protein JHK85_001264 [Glycine max]|nr:hypothetical protein JHK85_001264 [Glycine max]